MSGRSTAGVEIECVVGDIARQIGFDAVVNAANAQLQPGGGVAGALHAAAGPELALACRPFAPIRPGRAVVTPAFGLPNQMVIHCLGPVYGRDEPADQLLRDCYRNALSLADERGATSIAFPALSTGVFGYPLREAARVAMAAVLGSARSLRSVKRIRFVLASDDARRVHEEELAAAPGED